MADLPRLNNVIRALEGGQHALTCFAPAHVDSGTGTDPIYTFTNSTNADQLSVAQYAPGEGSHGGRWAVYHVTWVNAGDAATLWQAFGPRTRAAMQDSANHPLIWWWTESRWPASNW